MIQAHNQGKNREEFSSNNHFERSKLKNSRKNYVSERWTKTRKKLTVMDFHHSRGSISTRKRKKKETMKKERKLGTKDTTSK